MLQAGRLSHLSYVEKVAALLLLVYPVLMLTVNSGMNGVFLIMLLLAIAALAKRPPGMAGITWRREMTLYVMAMLGMTAAILISQTALQTYTAHPHDAASRYWLGIPVFLLLYRLSTATFAGLQYAFPLAAIIGLVLAREMYGRLGLATLDLIHFGDFELMLGILSLYSIDWFRRDGLASRIFKTAGFIAGLSTSLMSGSRGGWLAIPVFLAIYYLLNAARLPLKKVLVGAGVALAVATATYCLSDIARMRVQQVVADVDAYRQGNRDTSVGIRLQLYQAAVEVFFRNPVYGVGPEGYANEMQRMLDEGRVSELTAAMGKAEVHNDILSKAVGMGVFGLAAILALYWVPFHLFWRAAKVLSGVPKRAAEMGLLFVGGFFVFGWTVEILNLTMAAAFYSFSVAVFLAICYNVHLNQSS